MKNFLFTSLAFLLITSIYSQGWVGTGTSTVYPVNSSLQLTPLNVGIGTSSPSAQFHTTGSVLFGGITNNNTYTRVLVQNSSGSLFWRDASTFGATNAWTLTGNAGTVAGTNFLGTTDNNRLVFKTNNTERMTILSNGYVGLNLNNPSTILEVSSPTADNHISLSGNAPSIRYWGTHNSNTHSYGSVFALATYDGAYTTTTKKGDFVILNLGSPYTGVNGGESSRDLILGSGLVSGVSSGLEVMRVTQVSNQGRVGIGTIAPTAQLHTTSTLRFENLPTGTGYALYVDANGNVRRGSTTSSRTAGDQDRDNDLANKVAELEAEISSLKMLLGQVLSKQGISMPDQKFIVYPNPSSSFISIKPANENTARESNKAIIRDLSGKTVATLSTFNRTANISLMAVANGTYFVTIYDSRNNPVQVEKIILSR